MKNYKIVVIFLGAFITNTAFAEEVEEIIVTSSYIDQTLSEIENPLHVVNGKDISSSASQSLGESIDDLLGVSSTDFGSGVGQPVIRGMAGNRVKILNNGMVVRDVSGLGADHINDIDLNNIQQIEVVRGPSSLLYSNGSIGGIINVVDNTIARRDFTTSETRLGLETQSVNDGDTYNLSYQNNIGGLNLSLSHKDSQFGNFDIPNGAVIHREEEHHDDDHDEEEGDHDEHEEDMGYLANSDFESESTRIGISKTGEWGYFGFSVVDQTSQDPERSSPRSIRRPSRLTSWESLRVADTIAGYWTVTPDGSWIIERQNRVWSGPTGPSTRWRDPWSAAFISWVMCEGGFAESNQFRRAIAHHIYIDQAIRVRDNGVEQAAFAAYDVGEVGIEPGDLLCTARRAAYRTLNERRDHLGVGARTHCDIVVKLDEVNQRILAIGGNVRGSVRLKILPAFRIQSGPLQPVDQSMIPNGRAVFAHLKLRADSVETDVLDNSPTIKALGERHEVLSLMN